MRDILFRELSKRRPEAAKGHFAIDLTDPTTGRVKERIEHDNHVFSEALYGGNGSNENWIRTVSKAWLCLNNSDLAIDTTVPFLFGQNVGYGVPSLGSSGLIRGASNAANQLLAAMTPTSVRWKFQYDFTSAQCNSVPIQTIGLTHQHQCYKSLSSGYFNPAPNAPSGQFIGDGRYAYYYSAGIITKIDCWYGTTATIDKTTVVGNSSNQCLGYSPATRRFYIYNLSTKILFVFSDGSFSTLVESYTLNTPATSSRQLPFYVGGQIGYFMGGSKIYPINIVNDTALPEITPGYSAAAFCEFSGCVFSADFSKMSCVLTPDLVALLSPGGGYSNNYGGIIFNVTLGTVVGYCSPVISNPYPVSLCPITKEKIVMWGDSYLSAIAAYRLNSPITKTSANGMTVTYELEVFW